MICISKTDKLEDPMQCCFSAMYLRLPFSIAPEFVKANSEKAQGLSRRASGRSLGRSVPQKLGSRAAVEMIMFTVQTFPPNTTELVLSRLLESPVKFRSTKSSDAASSSDRSMVKAELNPPKHASSTPKTDKDCRLQFYPSSDVVHSFQFPCDHAHMG